MTANSISTLHNLYVEELLRDKQDTDSWLSRLVSDVTTLSNLAKIIESYSDEPLIKTPVVSNYNDLIFLTFPPISESYLEPILEDTTSEFDQSQKIVPLSNSSKKPKKEPNKPKKKQEEVYLGFINCLGTSKKVIRYIGHRNNVFYLNRKIYATLKNRCMTISFKKTKRVWYHVHSWFWLKVNKSVICCFIQQCIDQETSEKYWLFNMIACLDRGNDMCEFFDICEYELEWNKMPSQKIFPVRIYIYPGTIKFEHDQNRQFDIPTKLFNYPFL